MANQKRISLKDLAHELGVSIATVSRALRNSPEIGQEMQMKVKELAKRLNYRPNPFAQSLRKEGPRIIGVVVPNLVTHFYAAVLDGIEDEARRADYSVISSNSHESCEDEMRAIDNFINLHVEGKASSPVYRRIPPIIRISRRSQRWASHLCSLDGPVCPIYSLP